MLNLKIDKKELDEFIGSFDEDKKERAHNLYLTLNTIAAHTLRNIQKNLSGEVLARGTGDLYKSVTKSKVYKKSKDVAAVDVGILEHVPHKHHRDIDPISTYVYGEAWETGFTYPETIIRAKYARVLHFYWYKIGKWVFTKQVRVPQRKEQARPWFWPGVAESLPYADKMLNAWAAQSFMRR